MKKTIAIFGVEAVDLYRYNRIFFDNVNNFEISENNVYLFCEERLSTNLINKFGMVFQKVNVVYTKFKSSKQLDVIFNKMNFDLLIINSYTIADIRVLKSIYNYKARVIYLQHGLYLKYMPRNFFFYFTNPKKILAYLLYAIDVNGSSSVKSLINIIKVYVLGKDRNVIPTKYISRVDTNLVFSEYWKIWHQENYKIQSPIFEVGYIDYYSIESKQYNNHIAYCAQTLVEDGRISKKQMLKFYSCLNEISIKFNLKIIIKVHPRNSSWTLKIFEMFGFYLEKDKIPLGNFTIGHYSTLLPIWGILNSKILIFKLPEHKIPESIRKISSKIVSFEDYQNFSENDLIDKDSEIKYYFGGKMLKSNFKNLING